MSTDRLSLAALEERTKAEVCYFELVELRFADQTQRCFICVGNHALFLVCRNLGELYPNAIAGEIFYAHIDRLVEDTRSVSDLLIIMNDNRREEWKSEQLLVLCEHRERLVNNLKAAWQTDRTWRLSIIVELPCIKKELQREPPRDGLRVQPFKGYQATHHEGYTFFLQQGYVDVTSSMHSASTGTFVDKQRELTFTIQIQDPQPLSDLESSGREHIRWVAMRQKQSMAEELHNVLVEINAFYLKKMNLTNDIASWTGWELFMKSDAQVRIVIFLRRQYVPPLMDSAQDIFVTLNCPRRVLDSSSGGAFGNAMLAEARLAADSMAPLVHRCTVPQTLYRDMIQARLDALLYGEEAMTWLRGTLGLQPEPALQREARCFMKSILKILQEENALASPELLTAIEEDVPAEKDPMLVPARMRGLGGVALGEDEESPSVNGWFARVARYLAYCLDGVLLGSTFALMDLTSVFIGTHRSQQRIEEVILFLLHVRPKDLTKKFVSEPIRHLIHDLDLFNVNTFNDRVMQSLVELGWIEKVLGRTGGTEAVKSGVRSLSLDYAVFLGRLLMCEVASINLKASICRQLISAGDGYEHFGVLCAALMHTVRQPNVYLKTYATVTLASMSSGHEAVNDMIMNQGIVELCIEGLRSSDDDLTRYTLVLLAHLSKNSHHRQVMLQDGIIAVLMHVLEKMPATPSKEALLAELCSVIGQLCNNDLMWEEMCNHPCKPVERLLGLFRGATACGRLRSKVMFALKIFCDRPKAHPQAKREAVAQLLPGILRDLKEMASNSATMDLDCATNGILLLATLAKSATVLADMGKLTDPEALPVLARLNMTELGTLDSTRDRLHGLQKRLTEE